MPNWCENKLTVTGPGLDEFVARARGVPHAWGADPGEPSALCFHALYPVPPEVLAVGFDGGAGLSPPDFCTRLADLDDYPEGVRLDGYHWQCLHWGTKWDVDGVEVEVAGGRACYRFDTAWSPPVKLFNRVARDFPALTFRLEFFEPGCDFVGHALWRDGRRAELEVREVTAHDWARWGYDPPEEEEEPEGG
jgi:hypothetical protein